MCTPPGERSLAAAAVAIRLPGVALAIALLCVTLPVSRGQSLGNAGTIEGVVLDPSGAVVSGADVSVRNSITGYTQSTASGSNGAFRLTNIPVNPY